MRATIHHIGHVLNGTNISIRQAIINVGMQGINISDWIDMDYQYVHAQLAQAGFFLCFDCNSWVWLGRRSSVICLNCASMFNGIN